MSDRDTIAAIAGGMTASGIGIVRISGPEAFSCAAAVFRPAKAGKDITRAKGNTVHYGHIYDGEDRIDEVLLLILRAPHSFTGEDTVEIDCHGGPFVMKRILETVLSHGARLPEPGEFTKRAFLNGRIDLAEAEAVMDIISSQSDDALKSSLSQLSGSLSGKIKTIRDKIITETAYIEAALDDPEHMDLTGYGEKLLEVVTSLEQSLAALLSTFSEGRMMREGIRTVILGKPNAGKSSILNYLSGADRAIVTDIAGTTRDTIEESIHLGGMALRLIDTAGIRETSDLIEKIGVEKASEMARDADLILMVIDSSQPLTEEDEAVFDLIKGRNAVILLNKNDLTSVVSLEDVRKYSDAESVFISAKEGFGREDLVRVIRNMFFDGQLSMNEEVHLTNVRHKEAVEEAIKSLKLAEESIRAGLPEDFYTIDLMDAYTSLGHILGEEVGEDLVNTIFSKFCMGK